MTLKSKVTVKIYGDDDWAMISGTSFKAALTIDYKVLCEMFGPPLPGDGHKVQAQWILTVLDEEDLDNEPRVVTVYDWKMGVDYCGPYEGVGAEYVTTWHVGAHTHAAAMSLCAYIEDWQEHKMEEDWDKFMAAQGDHWMEQHLN